MFSVIAICFAGFIGLLVVHTAMRESGLFGRRWLPLSVLRQITSLIRATYHLAGWYCGILASKAWELLEYLRDNVFRAFIETMRDLWVASMPAFSFSEFAAGLQEYLNTWRPADGFYAWLTPGSLAMLSALGFAAFSTFVIVETVLRESGLVPDHLLPVALLTLAVAQLVEFYELLGWIGGTIIARVWDVLVFLRDSMFHSLWVSTSRTLHALLPISYIWHIFSSAYDYVAVEMGMPFSAVYISIGVIVAIVAGMWISAQFQPVRYGVDVDIDEED